MNKHALSFLILIALSIGSFGQCIPVDTTDVSGYYPPTLPPAYAGEHFEDTLNVLVISDTIIKFAGQDALVRVDSAILTDVVGLPESFSFDCYNRTCRFTPDEMGCAIVRGDPTEDQIGIHPIGLVITMYGKVFGAIAINQSDTLNRFVIDVRSNTAYLREVVEPAIKVYPNPLNGNTDHFSYTGPVWSEAILFDDLGRKQSINIDGNRVKTSSLNPGIYFIMAKLENGSTYRAKLFID